MVGVATETGLLVVNVVLLFVLSYQTLEFRRQRQEAEALRHDDHVRRCRQGTIEFYATLRSSRQALRDTAERVVKQDVMSDDAVQRLRKRAAGDDAEALQDLQAISAHLAGLEWFAVGVHTNVFDLDIADRLGGTHIVATARMFERFIASSRVQAGSPTLYCELEALARQIAERRTSMDTRGKLPTYD